MATRGRKKGSISIGQPIGSRSASGRLRKRPEPRVEPCEGVQRRHALYRINHSTSADAIERRNRRDQTDTCDALGRAYMAGLLGNDDRARKRLEAGRKIAAQYWRIYGFSTPDSLARFQPQRPANRLDPDKEKIIEAAMNDGLEMVRDRGRNVARAFEQLVIDMNPDHGPAWLDRIVFSHRSRQIAQQGDMMMMELAIKGLDAIA